jgi:hypothetical protein
MTLPLSEVRAAHRSDGHAVNLGAVFTRQWVAELVLDLAGYTADADLARAHAVEPAVGHGAFLIPMVRRLVASSRRHGVNPADIGKAITGFDIDPGAVRTSRAAVYRTLIEEGIEANVASVLASSWIREGDFLKSAFEVRAADWVIGNPPYVRVEDVDRDDMAAYRAVWMTMSGRADVYVGFIEAGLTILRAGGRLAFICADRWMRNQYGNALRRKIEADMAVDACLTIHGVEAFDDKVAAYPAIILLRNGEQGRAMICDAGATFDAAAANRLLRIWRSGSGPVGADDDFRISWRVGWFAGSSSWPDGDPVRLGVLAELEGRFQTLEDTGAYVGVGVATGADDVFITSRPGETEADRLMKLVGGRELSTGHVAWAGKFLVNPWADDGLIPLVDRPGMAAYLRRHSKRLKSRYVAKKNDKTWWRTIDRVNPVLAQKPKLLIPDLKERISPVLDHGEYYPGHSVYHVTSDVWDLEVLGGLLMSDLATLFVEAYSVRMANGYLRVSAQYLRRVRVPKQSDLRDDLCEEIRQAFRRRDLDACNLLAEAAYGLV